MQMSAQIRRPPPQHPLEVRPTGPPNESRGVVPKEHGVVSLLLSCINQVFDVGEFRLCEVSHEVVGLSEAGDGGEVHADEGDGLVAGGHRLQVGSGDTYKIAKRGILKRNRIFISFQNYKVIK